MSKSSDKNSRLVYSTDQGRISEKKASTSFDGSADGTVRIRRETKGRKGKGVTIVEGLSGSAAELKTLAKKLKQLCGTGGAVKDGIIEIQGDQREALKLELEKQGHKVKLAGG